MRKIIISMVILLPLLALASCQPSNTDVIERSGTIRYFNSTEESYKVSVNGEVKTVAAGDTISFTVSWTGTAFSYKEVKVGYAPVSSGKDIQLRIRKVASTTTTETIFPGE